MTINRIGPHWATPDPYRTTVSVPQHRLSTYGRLPFAVVGPTVWNSLPEDMWDREVSEDSYRQSLKTFLADRTNGRAIATLLRLSSVCLSSSVCDVMYCG